ncbi:outer membrane protein assembly factor BamB family protein [Haloarchaeobius sp. DT45]|uniref:outer membrane protein assembly factor BamB family protein n=1 Tax=Haloarchaeobius sp. DT45 TaxID=3446116 RepID=UPI003F6D0634
MNRRRFVGRLAAVGSLTTLAGCNGIGGSTDSQPLPEVGRAEGCGPYEPTVTGTPEWRTVGGDPAGTGVVPADAVPSTPLTVDWTAPIAGVTGSTRPVATTDRVYTHDLDSTLYAVDAATGELAWGQNLTDPRGSPAITDEAIVVLSEHRVVGLAPEDGEVLWTGPSAHVDVFNGSPVVVDDTAYVPHGLALYALDVTDGTVRWRHETGEETVATPAVADGTVFYGDEDTYVYALDVETGTERWRHKTDSQFECNVSVAGGVVCTAARDGTVLALDTGTGIRLWSYTVGAKPQVVASDGAQAYVATEGRVYAFDLGSGRPCWSTGAYDGAYDSGLAVGGGHVYAPGSTRTTSNHPRPVVIDAASGETTWSDDPRSDDGQLSFEMGPVVVDGAVYATGGGANSLRLTRMS